MLDEAKEYREKSKHDRPAVSHDKRSYTASLNWGHLVRSYEKEKITPASSRAVVDRPLKPSEISVRYERAPAPLGLLTMQPVGTPRAHERTQLLSGDGAGISGGSARRRQRVDPFCTLLIRTLNVV